MTLPPSSRTPAAPDGLERATRRVIEDHAGLPLGPPDRELLQRELRALTSAIRMALRDSVPAPPGPSAPSERPAPSEPSAPAKPTLPNVPTGGGRLDRLRLLRVLRTALVEEWSDADGPMLPVMHAFEAVQDGLLTRGEAGAATDVMSPFSRAMLREVAHLLRSPLGSLVMLSGALVEAPSGSLTDRERHHLGIVHRAAIAAAQTTGDLLTLWSEGDLVGQAESFSVQGTLERVADVVRPVAEARHTSLQVHTGVKGSRTGPLAAVEQVLLTLGLRAALGTREGSLDLGATDDEGEAVEFRVVAEGYRSAHDPESGEEDADPLRLFLVDHDAGTFTLSAEGLSLSAARRILRSLGSELDVDANGKGRLSVGFRLPLPPPA